MDDREIVSAIRARLILRVGKERCEVWFGARTELAVRGDALVVSVPSDFFQDWMRRHFRKDLEAAAHEASGRSLALEFRIDPTLAAAGPTSGSTRAKPRVVAAPSASVEKPATEAPRTARCRFHTLETFVVGGTNCLAHKAAQLVAERPGTYSPVLFHGPTATGKTHLLEGICTAFRRFQPGARTLYLSAEQFTCHFIEAVRGGGGLPSFRRKHRDVDLLAVDDLQFFAGKRATLVELLSTVDALLRAGKQLVFAADRSPAALRTLGSELSSRLSGGMACPIEQPDYTTRLGIVRQMASRLDIALPDDVAAYIASHFTTQSRELAGALKRLHAASLAHSRPIVLALAEEALADLIDHQGRVVRLADIERAVCDVCGLDDTSLQSGGKAKTVSYPRMLAMWLARKHTRAALSEIGSYFGRRSHSTVISAQKKIEGWMADGAHASWLTGSITLEETIRRVEERLRA